MDMNHITILGRLGQDAELRYTKNGEPVIQLSVATAKRWKDKQTDEWKEKTTWFKAHKFGKVAEAIAKVATKGTMCFISGSMECRQWQDKEGRTQYSWEINADNVVVSNAIKSDNPQGNFSQNHQPPASQGGMNENAMSGQGSFTEDDIPF